MNSKIKYSTILALGLLCNSAEGVHISTNHKLEHQLRGQGIFGRMIEQAVAPERLAEERHEATERKKKQLEDAQKDYDKSVA